MRIDRAARTATITVAAPAGPPIEPRRKPSTPRAPSWWPLRCARELDDAILHLRTNELGDRHLGPQDRAATPTRCSRADAVLAQRKRPLAGARDHGTLRRTLARLDVTARSLFALVEPGSCFAGTLLELALAADRIYMLDLPDRRTRRPRCS